MDEHLRNKIANEIAKANERYNDDCTDGDLRLANRIAALANAAVAAEREACRLVAVEYAQDVRELAVGDQSGQIIAAEAIADAIRARKGA